MGSEGLPVDRLRAYLGKLAPEARALLAAEIARGAPLPGAALILEALRPAPRIALPPQLGAPARLFLQPVEPFLADAGPGAALPGRIERSSILPLWEWIERVLAPEETRAYAEQVAAALHARSQAQVDQLVAAFQDAIAAAIADSLDSARRDERFRRRLAAQIALPHALDDLQTLQRLLLHREPVARMAEQLPACIGNLAGGQVEAIIDGIRLTAAGRPELLLACLILVLNRLAAPWQLIRLAIAAAQSDSAARIQQTPFALAVTLVLADLDCGIERTRTALREGRIADATAACRDIHDTVRGLRTELDLFGDPAFSRELAALRRGVSDLLRAEIEAVPGRVRRLLRPAAVKDFGSAGRLDAIEVAETEARIELVGACRNFAGELALNQSAPKAHAELQLWFDTGMPVLLEALRQATATDRPFRQSQVDAAIRFAGQLFGGEYAALLAKAAAVAVAEREAATA